ncbi:MAG: hypothetical protein ACTHJT_13640 [Cytophaga sp.]|uniref:hypothetical protein n=1 Tax=Cytophaga sp. TaxID=29535 RepID=UPI003F7FFB73
MWLAVYAGIRISFYGSTVKHKRAEPRQATALAVVRTFTCGAPRWRKHSLVP